MKSLFCTVALNRLVRRRNESASIPRSFRYDFFSFRSYIVISVQTTRREEYSAACDAPRRRTPSHLVGLVVANAVASFRNSKSYINMAFYQIFYSHVSIPTSRDQQIYFEKTGGPERLCRHQLIIANPHLQSATKAQHGVPLTPSRLSSSHPAATRYWADHLSSTQLRRYSCS